MSDMQPYDPSAPHPARAPDQPTIPQFPVPAAPPWTVGQPSWQAPMMLTDRREPDTAVVVIAWVVAVLTAFYMLPWAIAATRGKSNQAAVGLINLLLGWTFIGWVVALVMACTAHQVVGTHAQTAFVMAQQFPPAYVSGPVAQPHPSPSPGWYPAPRGQGQQYWDGSAWTEHNTP